MTTEALPDGRIRVAGGDLDAQAVDELLRTLGKHRAQMHPPQAARPVGLEYEDVTDDPRMTVGMLRTGRLLMSLCHAGFGWCHFELSPQGAAALCDFIQKRLGSTSGAALDDGQGGGHAH